MVQANLHFEGYVGGVEGYLNDRYEVRSDFFIENLSLHSDRFTSYLPLPRPFPNWIKIKHFSFFYYRMDMQS
jgi:hypothetical protein